MAEDPWQLVADLQAENAVLRAIIAELMAEVTELKASVAMNSRNSSKPPSSDGYAKPAPKCYLLMKRGSVPMSEGCSSLGYNYFGVAANECRFEDVWLRADGRPHDVVGHGLARSRSGDGCAVVP